MALNRASSTPRMTFDRPDIEMPKLDGILETALYVDDIERAAEFYQTIMRLSPLFSDKRLRAFDVSGRGVLLLFARGQSLETINMPGGTIPPHDGSGPLHLAFSIAKESLEEWRAHLAAHEVAIEGEATWPRGAVSLYFRDPDGHLVELATPGLWPGY